MKRLFSMVLFVVMLLSVECALAEEEVPAVDGISRILISVFDLDESVAFYTEKMELTAVAEGELAAEDCLAAYGFESAARYAMLKNDVQTTLIELIEFAERPEKTSREGYNSWDLGYYDVSFRCADIVSVYDEMTADGFEFVCEPYEYTTTWSGDKVFESVMTEMNGVPLAMINKTVNTPEFEGSFRNCPDVVLVVGDMDVADAFYTGVLDCPKVFDMWLEKGLVDPIVGVAGTDYNTRIAMYMGSGATPVIEVLEFDTDGRSMTAEGASVPQNAGMFATGFMVEDLDVRLARANEAGFGTVLEPSVMALAPYGEIRTAMVAGPDGALFELFEVL